MGTDVLPVITIDLILDLDRLKTKYVLQGILHAILFHRMFGPVKSQTFEVLDVTMPGIKDDNIELLVNENVEAFLRRIEASGPTRRGQILVTMSELRTKRNWWSNTEQDLPWEQWVVNVELRQPKTDLDRENFTRELNATLTKALHKIIEYVSSERGRAVVPPITDAHPISPFPYKITTRVGNVDVG